MTFSETLSQHLQTASGFVQTHILTGSTLFELLFVMIAFIAGYVLHKKTHVFCHKKIDSYPILTAGLKRLLHHMVRLVPHIVGLVLLSVIIVIGHATTDYNFIIITATAKLTLAWVFIRLMSLVIGNRMIRQIIATIAWIVAALSIIGFLQETLVYLDSLGLTIGKVKITALTISQGLIALILLVYGASILASILDKRLELAQNLAPASRVLISKIVRIVLITIAILTGIGMAGIDLSLLFVFSGAIGLGLGFGLQRGISNLFSGMLLLFDRSIQPGEVIELQNGTYGVVKNMAGRQVEIITRDNRAFLIPNEDLVTQQVVNWSRGDPNIRLEVEFGVDYSHNPHEIIKLALEAVQKPERVVSHPEPVCHFSGFGDSSLDFTLRFWIVDAQNGVANVRNDVLLALWDIFDANDVKIPFPHRQILTTKE